ncbi:MAG: Ig-like domain-containing protein [Lachnospiraceae bacterium]|nr:Ig-like domain-containing protein [Lachnospiraceae bacterium]
MKKKNIFDTDIEMVNLDTIGNLEVSYDEMSSPNPELANDVQMVMKETQVFSADDVAAAIQRNNEVLNDLGNIDETKIINADELSEIGETKIIDTVRVNELEAEDNYDETQDAPAKESDYIVSDGDYEFETEDPGEEEYETEDSEEEYESETEETVYEDDSEEEFENQDEEADNDYEFETEESDDTYESEESDDYEFETEDDEDSDIEEYEDYEFEPDEPKHKKHVKDAAVASKEKKVREAKEPKVKEVKEAKVKETKEPKAKEAKEARIKEAKANAEKEPKVKEAKGHSEKDAKVKEPKTHDKKKHAVAAAETNGPKKHKAKPQDADFEIPVQNAKKKHKNHAANADVSAASAAEAVGEEIADAVSDIEQNTEIEAFDNAKRVSNEKRNKKKNKTGFSLGIVEYSGIAIGIVLIILLVILGAKLSSNKIKKNNIQQFASIGELYSGIDSIGNEGINAIAEQKQISSITPAEDEKTEEVKEDEKEKEEEVKKDVAPISVNFSSIEKDLKIKFVNKNTGKLVTGIKFEVNAKGPKGDNFNWVDTDMDGVIYINNLQPGTYEVTVVSVDPYEFPDTATKVKVQDTVVYQVINVMDEAVDMSQVNLAQEENQAKDVDQGTELQDTVKLVDSTATPVEGKDGFVKVNKADIKDPKSYASAHEWGGFRRVDDVQIEKGATVNAVAIPEGCSVSWEGGDGIAAGNADGSITGIAAGNCTLTATIKDADENVKEQKTFNVTVTEAEPADVKVTALTINGSNEVKVGASIKLDVKVDPDNATKKEVIWSSSNDAVATVDGNGNVTGVGEGSATIKVLSTDGSNVEGSFNVNVIKDAPAVPLTLTVTGTDGKDVADSITLYPEETYQLNIRVEGYVSDGGVKIESSNNAVTVSDNGLITAAAVGTADVVISTNEKDAAGNQIVKKISVTVKDDPSKDSTKPLTYSKDGKDLQVYYKNAEGNYVEAKWADYYKYDEFYVKGDVEYKYTGWQTIDGNVYYFNENGEKVTGEQIIGGTKYHFASDGTLIKDNGSRGIDVSTYNGTIDWTAVKNSGISFVIIRCGFRGYTKGGLILDSKYQSYIQGATAAGLKVGLYLFSQATNEAEAVEEASLCVNLAQGYKISYPIFIDSEYANGAHSGRADGLDKATRTAVCKAFCETIKSAGYTPGVYASKSWLYNKLDAGQLSGYKIWLAHYTGETDYTGKYDLWQHTDKGSVNGIKGKVDLDISYLGY